MRVLFDGWPLVHPAGVPPVLHLLALLEALPPGVEALVALPGASPHRLPERVDQLRLPSAADERSRLRWEQRLLPGLARQAGAQLLHLVTSHPPLAAGLPVVISPADDPRSEIRAPGLAGRARAALARGAQGAVSAWLWPEDLPAPTGRPLMPLPPLVHPAFTLPLWQSGLPGEYILYLGPTSEPDLRALLSAWSWAAGAVGEHMPLLLPGLDARAAEQLGAWLREGDFGSTVQPISALTVEDWAALVRGATLLAAPGAERPWGGALQLALAAGKPLVGVESPDSSARVGPAGYLVPPRDGRALGAALTTLAVETEMAENLARAAADRASGWNSGSFAGRLLAAYEQVVSGRA